MKFRFFPFLRQKAKRSATKQELSSVSAWSTSGFFSRSDRPMLLSTVYRCVDLISDSVAMLPLETYRIDWEGFKKPFKTHPAYSILDAEPNGDMTRFTFFKTMVSSMLLKGNAYAYIERDSSLNVVQLIYIPSDYVGLEWIMDANGVQRKRYRVSGFKDLVEPASMIHVLNFSYDGITGVSTLAHARNTIELTNNSEAHAEGFFTSGANTAGVLSVDGVRLNDKQRQEIYDTWEARTNPITGRPNGIVVLEQNMHYQPITVNPRDSQLLESRQFNVVDICRFFSVSPVKAFDLSKSSYSTVEATQLAFLTDTLSPLLSKIELEINRKVFLPSERSYVRAEFNTSALLRADKAAQSTYWREMFNVGAATPNEIRRESNLPRIDGGDKAFVQVNVQTLEKAVSTENSTENIGQNDGKNKGNEELPLSGQS